MQNPFESGHIKNYLLLYASIVVIMILFFIASTLFNDIKDVKKKEFNTKTTQSKEVVTQEIDEESSPKFRLLDTAY
ncbi:hypothetical protein JHD49_08945 [Sulfurimonas sp. SAG-AH-194-C21]|nr:hypothetical protein [Sulfurimonas sp. SAG-AH-194-C21]MDF1884064.1 hypothetical protein [Sulfurimonas sp. SAG-AH-194-C21]